MFIVNISILDKRDRIKVWRYRKWKMVTETGYMANKDTDEIYINKEKFILDGTQIFSSLYSVTIEYIDKASVPFF